MKKLFIFAGLIAIIALIVIPFQESENERIVMSDFFLENIEGETISIGEFRGEKHSLISGQLGVVHAEKKCPC